MGTNGLGEVVEGKQVSHSEQKIKASVGRDL